MSAELANGFTVHVDGNLVAVEDTFDAAKRAAATHIASSSQATSFQIRSASSVVVASGRVGAAPLRAWNYDRTLKQWVEFIQ